MEHPATHRTVPLAFRQLAAPSSPSPMNRATVETSAPPRNRELPDALRARLPLYSQPPIPYPSCTLPSPPRKKLLPAHPLPAMSRVLPPSFGAPYPPLNSSSRATFLSRTPMPLCIRPIPSPFPRSCIRNCRHLLASATRGLLCPSPTPDSYRSISHYPPSSLPCLCMDTAPIRRPHSALPGLWTPPKAPSRTPSLAITQPLSATSRHREWQLLMNSPLGHPTLCSTGLLLTRVHPTQH